MKRMIFYLASMVLAVMVIAGCSSNDPILGSNESETGALLRPSAGLSDGIFDDSNIDNRGEIKDITIEATVHVVDNSYRPEICLYLEDEDGKQFVPIYSDRSVTLSDGMVVLAKGKIVEAGPNGCDLPLAFSISGLQVLDIPPEKPKSIYLQAYYFNQAQSPQFGDCNYLETDNGQRYFPVFKVKNPDLKNKSLVDVYGFIDPDYSAGCDVGPAIIVQEFKLVQKSDKQDDSGKMVNLKGVFQTTVKGCPYLEIESSDSPKEEQLKVELDFGSDDLFNISDGSRMEVSGYYSALDISNCNVGPLFNVVEYQLISERTPGESNGKGKE